MSETHRYMAALQQAVATADDLVEELEAEGRGLGPCPGCDGGQCGVCAAIAASREAREASEAA